MTPILRRAPGEHPGLLTDLYHPDSAYVAWRVGRSALTTFDLYARRAPFGGAYLLVAGLEMALEFVRSFRYADDDLAFLAQIRDYDPAFLDHLTRPALQRRDPGHARGLDRLPQRAAAARHRALRRGAAARERPAPGDQPGHADRHQGQPRRLGRARPARRRVLACGAPRTRSSRRARRASAAASAPRFSAPPFASDCRRPAPCRTR